jgi:hypothetical protein
VERHPGYGRTPASNRVEPPYEGRTISGGSVAGVVLERAALNAPVVFSVLVPTAAAATSNGGGGGQTAGGNSLGTPVQSSNSNYP